jgi:HEAT repeat protein
MGFIKSTEVYKQITFDSFLEAQNIFENINEDLSLRLDALEYLLTHKEISYILDLFYIQYNDDLKHTDHSLIDYAFASFGIKSKKEEDFNRILKILDSKNAYLRNKAIIFLQDSGETAKEFIKKLLKNKNRDIRIFAINVLSDVKYEDSRDMLMELILKEDDINALMTAIEER